MYNIRELRLESVEESQWIRIKQVNYKQNGIEKSQEIICSHDSCGILIRNKTRNVFIFVRQFRPAVFMHQEGWSRLKLNSEESVDLPADVLAKGFTLELCAGILDKPDRSVAEIAAEEVLEECGYRVCPRDLEMVLSTRNNSLHSGTLQHLFYAEVTDDMKVEGSGGGVAAEGEFIDVVEVKVEDALGALFDEDDLPKPIGLTFALVWFLFTKTGSSDFRLSSANGHHHHDDPPTSPSRLEPSTPEKRKRPPKDGKDRERNKKQKPDDHSKKREKRKNSRHSTDPKSCDGGGSAVVSDVSVSDERTARELQIYRLWFRHTDTKRAWDFFRVRSTCSVLVHDVDRDAFLLVRKFSPAIFASLDGRRSATDGPIDPRSACLNQLCSTSYDEGAEPCRYASSCVRDTFGYQVPPEDFKKIIQSRSNVGVAGALMTLFYVRVAGEMKLPESKAKEATTIPPDSEKDFEVVEVPVASSSDDDGSDSVDGLELLMFQGKNPMSLSLALLWYYYRNPVVKSQ